MNRGAFGFIDPDESLQSLELDEIHKHLNITIKGGHRAKLKNYRDSYPGFNKVVDRTEQFNSGYEDQCSARYYSDMFQCVHSAAGKISRVIVVGVFMGGASVVLAGCAHELGLELDLIDIGDTYLRFAYERIRRTYPEHAHKVRLFHGDLRTYIRDVLMKEQNVTAFVNHDAGHSFNQVVIDLGSLYYVKEKVHGIAVQDTHLRGMPAGFKFVDAAIFAIFGFNTVYAPIGFKYKPEQTNMTNPNPFDSNYFLPDTPEGWYLTLEDNTFKYPHPSISFDAFFVESNKTSRYAACLAYCRNLIRRIAAPF